MITKVEKLTARIELIGSIIFELTAPLLAMALMSAMLPFTMSLCWVFIGWHDGLLPLLICVPIIAVLGGVLIWVACVTFQMMHMAVEDIKEKLTD